MPVIRIKKKGLPKAQYQNSEVTTTTTASPSSEDFSLPLPKSLLGVDPSVDISPDLKKEQEQQAAEEKNYQNWLQDPRNEMSVSSWGSQGIFRPSATGIRYDPNKKYDAFGKEIQDKKKKPFDFEKLGDKLGAYTRMFRIGLGAAEGITGYLEDQKRQKEFDKQLRRSLLPENMYAVSPGGDRGDFDINTGIFQPNKLTPPNVGAAFARFGGPMLNDDDMDKIKIRFKDTTSKMKYGGQSEGMALGLDLGQKDVYRHMPKEKSEFARSVIQEVPREEANIEAEKGETVLGDFDDDGGYEHLKIGGERHTEGGTPLNVPEGSFVFSDTKKMIIKDPNVLAYFGMAPKKEGYTPAEIAKKYDVTKYKAIIEDPYADDVRKSTANLMVKNFLKKLGILAMIQEEKKGFPQGIPEVSKNSVPEIAQQQEANIMVQQPMQDERVMEQGLSDLDQEEEIEEESFEQEAPSYSEQPPLYDFGGITEIPMYQDAGQVMLTQEELQRKYPWYKPYTESKTEAGRISRTTGASTLFDPSVPSQYNDVDWWVQDAASKGVSINNIGDLQKYVYQELEKADPRAIREMWKKFGPTLQSEEQNLENFADALAGARTAFALSKRKPRVTIQAPKPEEDIPTPSYYGPNSMAEQVFPKKKAPYAWFTPDVVNMAAAASVAPRKRLPYIAQAAYEPGRLSLEDWRAQAAARQSMYNKVADTLGVYSGGPGLTANLSSMTGQQAEGLAGDIAGVTSRNVDRVNQFLQGERQRKDQFNLLGANRATELYKGNVIANQQYDNARRQYLNNLAKTYGKGFANAMYAGMINAVNPFFQLNPRSGQSFFTGRGFGTGRLGSSGFSSGASGFPSDEQLSGISQLKKKYKDMYGISDSKAEQMAFQQLAPLYSSSGRGSDVLSQLTQAAAFPALFRGALNFDVPDASSESQF